MDHHLLLGFAMGMEIPTVFQKWVLWVWVGCWILAHCDTLCTCTAVSQVFMGYVSIPKVNLLFYYYILLFDAEIGNQAEFETWLNVIFGTSSSYSPSPSHLRHQAAGAQGLLSTKPIGTQLGLIRRDGGWKRAGTERAGDSGVGAK